jgi:hypothetical protein
MNWSYIASVFFVATFKFMLAPFTGSALPFWENYLACAAGGSFSAGIFYFSSELILHYTRKRKIKKQERLEKLGKETTPKKKFTKTNRLIIHIKHKLGIYGICFWAPFFLSIPIGCIIAAKFYGKLKKTYPLIVLGMFLNALILCGIVYLIF